MYVRFPPASPACTGLPTYCRTASSKESDACVGKYGCVFVGVGRWGCWWAGWLRLSIVARRGRMRVSSAFSKSRRPCKDQQRVLQQWSPLQGRGSAAHSPKAVALAALDRPQRASGATKEPANGEATVGKPIATMTIIAAPIAAR